MTTIRVYLEDNEGSRSHDVEFSYEEIELMSEDDIRLAFVNHLEFDFVVIEGPETYALAA